MEFSKKLYELRKKNGLSQEELANRLNVSRQTISKWESGDSAPEMEKLVMLGDYFNISLDELVLGKVQNEQNISNSNLENKKMAQILDERVFTEANKNKAKKGLKITGIIFAVLLAVDVISMIVYLAICGVPC